MTATRVSTPFRSQSAYATGYLTISRACGRISGHHSGRGCAPLEQRAVRCPCSPAAGANPITDAAEAQLERVLTLTGRLSLRQSEVAAIYGSPQEPTATPPLVTLAMLTTVPGEEVTVREAEVGWTAQRLAQSAAYERRSLYELDARVRYATAQPDPSPLVSVAGREAGLLRNVLAGVRLLEVRAPFPTDPRKVADALAQWC